VGTLDADVDTRRTRMVERSDAFSFSAAAQRLISAYESVL
jgi:hypothetical protein